MCNGQCNGNCGNDKPKTVKELYAILSDNLPAHIFAQVKITIENMQDSDENKDYDREN